MIVPRPAAEPTPPEAKVPGRCFLLGGRAGGGEGYGGSKSWEPLFGSPENKDHVVFGLFWGPPFMETPILDGSETQNVEPQE